MNESTEEVARVTRDYDLKERRNKSAYNKDGE